MKVKNKKNVLRTIAGLALSGALVLGGIGLYGIINNSDPMQDALDNYTAVTAKFHQGEIDGQTAGKTYYVAPEGTGTEYTSAAPGNILTLLNGNTVKPGDTVLVKEGEYKLGKPLATGDRDDTQRIKMGYNGEYNKYITIKKDPAATANPVLNFTQMKFDGNNRGVQIDGDYFYWYGIDIMGAGDNGMYIGGNYNVVEGCEFYNNRDTGLQLGRTASDNNGQNPEWANINNWPCYNIVKNCTSHNNYDNETKGENADGFACKLTVGYGNVFDGCIAYRNSDDGWDLYAKGDSGNIGTVLIYNCVAFENGFVEYKRSEYNALFPNFDKSQAENVVDGYTTNNGDGNGFKLGGESMEADIFLYNCLSFNNRLHGFTDNSNPGFISVRNCTAYNNNTALATAQVTINDNNEQVHYNEGNESLHGQVITSGYRGDASQSANIDLHRHAYSYNSIENVLAIGDFANNPGTDVILGSATNSILNGGKNVISGAIDADISAAGTGSALTPADIFEMLPIVKNDTGNYTYNLSGLEDSGMQMPTLDQDGEITVPGSGVVSNPNRVHLKYRNADGSVNMGNILKIKADAAKVGEVQTGAHLSETTDTYKHDYFAEDLSVATSADNAVLLAAKDALYLPTDENAVFRDFELASKIILGTQVNWTSSNEDIIKIGKVYNTSNSSSEYVTAEVFRPAEDTEVTLTAKLNYKGLKTEREFTVNVKGGQPTLGDMYVQGTIAGELVKLEEGQTTIVDMYLAAEEPALVVTNGLDGTNKVLDESLYTVKTTYEYGKNGMADFLSGVQEKVPFFTSANDGVFKITHTVTLTADNTQKTVSYYVNVASNQAEVKFLNDQYTLAINLMGYTITGSPTGAIGTLYSLALPATDEAPSAEEVVEKGVAMQFRATELDMTFEHENKDAYKIYTVFENGAGEITSDVYMKEVGVVEIDTAAKFHTLATAGKLGEEDPTTTIYLITKNLSFSSLTWKSSNTTNFAGLINGNGHVLSDIAITKTSGSNAGVFYRFSGTLSNVAFKNVTITGAGNKAGIIAESYAGYVSNVKLTNVKVNAGTGNSAGVLVGQISSSGSDSALYTQFYVDRVSIIGCEVKAAGGRIGGIAGAVQVSGSSTEWINLNATNCYVDKTSVMGENQGTDGEIVTVSEYVGGLFGRLQNQNDNNVYYIGNCYSEATIYAKKNGAAQIVAAFNAAQGDITVENCAAAGKIYWGALQSPLEAAEKNASGIVGKFYQNIKVKNCRSVINEYFGTAADGEYEVTRNDITGFNYTSFWTALKFDMSIWTFTPDNSPENKDNPQYSMTLNFEEAADEEPQA